MRVIVDGIGLYFDVDGAGLVAEGEVMTERPVLVLLHGGPGGDHSLFKPEFTAMSDVAQVVYLDQRGSGRSDRGDPAAWTWQRWADDVAEFCAVVGLRRVLLVGTSSGGLVGMTCAARFPELVAGLVLDSTLGAPTTLAESLDVFERRGGVVAREAAARFLGGDTSSEAASAWWEYALPLYGADAGDTQLRRTRAKINEEVQDHFRQGGCGPVDVAPFAASIVCPTLILAGQDDPVSPAVGAQRLADSLTGSPVRMETLDRVGHGVFRQAPDRAFDLLRAFLPHLASLT
ncbi:alpha/beta hydrolase [Kribbella sp.]|uniref:alpha/beta fold hydrolase n=1 Tax=Kribbella sp. TaxID=1871183 RepID=UPI002D308DD2|nr:alpha/beta hydrolase [Kribbella sp.]HZX04035.1 alpha/beta hydrolase [Kribbella sp.]